MQDSGKVKVEVSDIGKTFPGRILVVVRHVDRNTGNFMLRIKIDNPNRMHLSGMLAKVKLPIGKKNLILTVPRDAIVRRGKKTHVVMVTGGKAKIVPVKVKGNRGDSVIVSGKGLAPRQKVVVRGNERLFPGMPVQVAETLPSSNSGKL